jgi:transcriptional regulator with XRE-family HTH domain
MLSQNIKAYRKLKGWTQEKLAVEFGLTRDNIASYERGLAQPSLAFACRICDDLKVSLHDFLYGEILNPKLGIDEKTSRVKELEIELAAAYKTIALMAQKQMSLDDREPVPITKAAEHGGNIEKAGG